MSTQIQFIREREVSRIRARSKSSTYQDISDGFLTKPVRIGCRSVAWPRYEIEALNSARLAGNSDDQIKELVNQLHAARKVAA